VCGRLDDVYDLAMATWVQARAGLATYDPSLPFLPWLQRVGLHVFFDLYRKEKPARRVTMPEEDEATLAEYSADGPGAALYAGSRPRTCTGPLTGSNRFRRPWWSCIIWKGCRMPRSASGCT